MQIRIDPLLDKQLRKLRRANPQLSKRIQKQLQLFQANPKQKSLRVHKLSGKLKNMWSISITKSIRMTYLLLDNDEAYFFKLGTHEEVYKRN